VRERLGYLDPPSYTQLLVRELTGIDLGVTWANGLTLGVFGIAAALSIIVNLRDRRH
jgi:hypothetical protein